MKRVIPVLVGALVAMLLTGVAGANSVRSQVQLDDTALFIIEVDPATSIINVGATVKCAGTATLVVRVDQASPPAATPGGAHGTGSLTFTCKRWTSQRVAVSIDITDGVFQPGPALAQATLV